MEVRRQVGGVDDEEPLIDLAPLFAAGGFHFAEARLGVDHGGPEALIFPGPDRRLLIRVDSRPNSPWGTDEEDLRQEIRRHRLRFRVAHEVAHSFFFERGVRGARRLRRSSPLEEAFCDHFATSLLVPPTVVARVPPVADSALELHRHYDVSVEVAVRALARAHPEWDMVLGYWREEEPTGPTNLRLQWASTSLAGCAQDALQYAAHTKSPPWLELTVTPAAAPRRQLLAVGRYSSLGSDATPVGSSLPASGASAAATPS